MLVRAADSPARKLSIPLRGIIEHVLFGAGEYLGNTFGNGTLDQVRPQLASWDIFKIEVFRRSAVRVSKFVGAAVGDDFVFNEADLHAP